MNKRVVAALAAVAFAAIGIILLISYANGANERAYDGAKLQTVLQVKSPVAANTQASDLKGSIEEVELPRSAVAKGAVSNLTEVSGLFTTVDLEPGEQLLLSRFSAEGAKKDEPEETKSKRPKGYQEVTIPLGSPMAVADKLKAGDRVGIVASYQTKEGDGVTQMIRNQVLILAVTGPGVKWDGSPGDKITQMITVAVKTRDVGKIVNALTFGKVWMTKQYPDTLNGQGGSISRDDVTE